MLPRIIAAILRPFAQLIRYGSLKLMKKLRPLHDMRPAIATADHILDETILPSVFKTFRDNRFRELSYFSKLTTAEHDRIFNELEVTGVCLGIFYLETMKPFIMPQEFHFWRDVEEYLPKQLQRKLVSLGTDGGNAKLFKQLIEMRYKEYEELAEHVSNISSAEKSEFKNLPPEMKKLGSLIQGAAIGTADHIRRGKIIERDPLVRYLITWLLWL